ncbi:hypothetical protein EDB92DRAFT_1789717 [Lactarius akahatsu]|uniref:DUF6589 domain-containing protein n=2 Tax=Lactarius akahatsu TaxID=416441 RepID=A0AAD4LQD5_9AGAM|nr:hypothetical protein EDB92DRAFT_1789717 [Lactarius akahatsu]
MGVWKITRYAENVYLVSLLNDTLTLPSLVRQFGGSELPQTSSSTQFPVSTTTPSSIYNPFNATLNLNSSFFSQALPVTEASLWTPSPVGWRPESRGGSVHGLGVHGLSPSPPLFPVLPWDTISCNDKSDDVALLEGLTTRQRKPKVSRMASLLSIIRRLQALKFTAIDLLVCVIDGQGEFEGFRNALFSPRNRNALTQLFDKLYHDDKGRTIFTDWMLPHSVTLVQETINAEMEAAKPHLRMRTKEVTPNFIEEWDIHRIMEPIIHKVTPTLTRIIVNAGESKASRAKTKSTNPCTFQASLIIMAQLHYLRSMYSAKIPIGLGLQAWASGTSRQMISVLHRTSLSVSYPSIASIIHSLANHSIERARVVSLRPHVLAYDNVNISSSIFVEQGPNTMSKVQSGTFAVIYELPGVRAEDMRILPMMLNLQRSSPLAISDLCPSLESMRSYVSQTAVTIVYILTKYVKGFDSQSLDASLQHIPRRPLPAGHKTVFHPLRATTIEEASIDGNLLVHDDVYLKDVSSWERREVFQLAFGTFHLVMNLLWSVLETHRGSVGQTGSLAFFFAILEKARLGGEHPDYHTLLSALKQILHGLILNAWQMESGYLSLRAFAEANPSPEELLRCAHRIIKKYTVPRSRFDHIDPKNPPRDLETGTAMPTEVPDTVHNNIVLLTRDLLYVVELVDATASGDFGRIEDVLPTIACMFRGAGSNNYSTEILHLLFNLKEVWTPEFAYVIYGDLPYTPVHH